MFNHVLAHTLYEFTSSWNTRLVVHRYHIGVAPCHSSLGLLDRVIRGPIEVKSHRHSHASIHDLEPRGNSILFPRRRDAVEKRYLYPPGMYFYPFRTGAPSRIYPAHLLSRHEYLEEVAPFRRS